MNQEFRMSITDFSVACGFYTNEYTNSADYINSYTDFALNFNPMPFGRRSRTAQLITTLVSLRVVRLKVPF